MRPHPRIRRVAKWVCTMGFVVSLATFVLSALGWLRNDWKVKWRHKGSEMQGYRTFVIAQGNIIFYSNDFAADVNVSGWPSMGWTFKPHFAGAPYLVWTPKLNHQVSPPFDIIHVNFPIYILVLISLIPTLFLWRRDRHPIPGNCRKCGYNLTANVSGKCPECGTKIDPGQLAEIQQAANAPASGSQ